MRLEGIEGRVAVVTGVEQRHRACAWPRRCGRWARRWRGSTSATTATAASTWRCRADVRDEAQVDAAFARAEAELGPVEMLVTCAGVFTPMAIAGAGASTSGSGRSTST